MLAPSEGYFSGYASIFGEPDQGGDVVMPGAFQRSLAKKGRTDVRLLFQHDPKEPIGRVLRIEEDAVGLRIEGQLFPDVPRAKALISLICGHALNGLSIGFRTEKAKKNSRTGHRHLLEVDLWEISIVTFPMMERARIFPVSTCSSASARPTRSPHETIAAAISLFSNH